MRHLCLQLIFCIIVTLPTAGCASVIRYEGTYEGQVIDMDTKEPIEGVVVHAEWTRETRTPAGAVHRYHDAMETATDKNGNFSMPGKGLLIMSNIMPARFMIFKAGYEYTGGSYESLKNAGWTGKYEEIYDPVKKLKMKKAIYNQKRKVRWEGKKAIIPLRKLTIEEWMKGSSLPDIPSEAPLEKVILMLREIDKHDKERGLKPRGIWKGEQYE